MPSIGICLSWRPGGSGRDGKCCRCIGIVLNHILLVNLFHIEDGLRSSLSLNPEVDIILMIFILPELPIRDNIDVKARDKYNVS
jgi:hypothetical protein